MKEFLVVLVVHRVAEKLEKGFLEVLEQRVAER